MYLIWSRRDIFSALSLSFALSIAFAFSGELNGQSVNAEAILPEVDLLDTQGEPLSLIHI